MKNKLVFAVITVLVLVAAFCFGNTCYNNSIGIIGGADGPTAIFVASSGIPTLVIVLNIIIVAAIAAFIIKKSKK